MNEIVSIIIPTLADADRSRCLMRAIRSVYSLDVPSKALVVINGDRYEKKIVDAAKVEGAEICHIPEFGVSPARKLGREMVETPYFGFLDDDDELLPEAGSVRLGLFEDDRVDVVVTNGYLVSKEGERRPRCAMETTSEDHALSILHENWLATAGVFYRTRSVSSDNFGNLPNLMELTMLGFRLALKYKIVRSNAYTYLMHEDAPNRVSSTLGYFLSEPQALAQLKRETEREDLRAELDRKIRIAHHSLADLYLASGNIRKAWAHHIQSLKGSGFGRYVIFTRHLLSWYRRPMRQN